MRVVMQKRDEGILLRKRKPFKCYQEVINSKDLNVPSRLGNMSSRVISEGTIFVQPVGMKSRQQ